MTVRTVFLHRGWYQVLIIYVAYTCLNIFKFIIRTNLIKYKIQITIIIIYKHYILFLIINIDTTDLCDGQPGVTSRGGSIA
jgi:hypothetical protein